MLFTQNIDCLERAAGIPPDRIVEAHGSFASQRCIDCKVAFDDAKMRAFVARGDVPTCEQEGEDGKPRCGGLVKPDIVFFGEALPSSFFELSDKVKEADLILVLGTSLQVHPFAGLPNMADEDVPRVLFNLERVGSFGTQADDVMVLADCDAGVLRLADLLGWKDELEKAWRELVGDEEADRQLQGPKKRAAVLHDEVAKLAEEVEEVLHIDDKESGKDGEDKHADQDKESPAAPPAEDVAGKRETPEPAVESQPQANPDLSGAEGQAPAKQGEKVDGVGDIADKKVGL
jgi:NAD-dependent histone deacetylase SIR2